MLELVAHYSILYHLEVKVKLTMPILLKDLTQMRDHANDAYSVELLVKLREKFPFLARLPIIPPVKRAVQMSMSEKQEI